MTHGHYETNPQHQPVQEQKWLPPEVNAQIQEHNTKCSEITPETFDVMYDNWPAWEMFQRVNSQWRVMPMGGIYALDHNVLLQAIGFIHQGQDALDLYDRVRLIERGALESLATHRNG